MAAVVKCLPVICLCGLVLTQGQDASSQQEERYNLFILLGLLFSLPGDFFLVWEFTGNFFLYGVVFFGIAHVFYAIAFGFSPVMLGLGLGILSLVGTVYLCYLPNLEGLYVPVIAMYMTVIGIMVWRAIVQLLSSVKETGSLKWTPVWGCVGALVFGLSDFILGTNKWIVPLPYARVLIMVTYWFGQMGLALSTCNPGNKFEKKQD